jgi:ribosomal protein S18 acetylase RimI-like enzyme
MLSHVSESVAAGEDGIVIRPMVDSDRAAVEAALIEAWSSPVTVVHDEAINVLELPALVALDAAGQLLGVVTFRECGTSYEVITLNALRSGGGIGTSLLAAVIDRARDQRHERVWLVTTNDNIDAIRFYQRRGLRLVNVDAGAVDRARVRKPTIPLIGAHGIELHDELTFEIRF